MKFKSGLSDAKARVQPLLYPVEKGESASFPHCRLNGVVDGTWTHPTFTSLFWLSCPTLLGGELGEAPAPAKTHRCSGMFFHSAFYVLYFMMF